MGDNVNSPDHYRWLPVEVIDITEHLSFTLGNVVKYVLRADHKGAPVEDLKKARWYLDREIARREGATSKPGHYFTVTSCTPGHVSGDCSCGWTGWGESAQVLSDLFGAHTR